MKAKWIGSWRDRVRSISWPSPWFGGALLLAWMTSAVIPAEAAKVLYVQNLSQRDTLKMIDLLQAQGHEVTVHTTAVAGDARTAAEYAAEGYQLLIVDEVIGSGSVGDRFRDSPIPVINWEGFLYNGTRSAFNADAELVGGTYASGADAEAAKGGSGADFGQVQDTTAIQVLLPDHPLAAGLPAGLVDVFDPAVPNDPPVADGVGVITFAGGSTFIAGATRVASVPGYDGGFALFGVDAGVATADGGVTAARWVHLPWNDSIPGRVLVEPSFFLFEAAVAWALDLPEPTKIRDLAPAPGGFLPATTAVSFSVDKVTAGGSAVAQSGIGLRVNGADVTGQASVTDAGSSWRVSYAPGFELNRTFTVVVSATAADGGTSARQTVFDTFDAGNYTIEAEDFNFDGGGFFDEKVLCDTLGGGVEGCFYDRVGVQDIDENEINRVTAATPLGNEVYRYGTGFDREEFTDTVITADPLVREKYTAAGIPDYEIRNIVTGEWVNYTRTVPAGRYRVYARVASAGALSLQWDRVEDATQTGQTLTKLGRFLSPGTGGYALVPLTDDSGATPLVLEFDGTATSIRATARSGGFTPNFYLFVPSTEAVNEPPVVVLTQPTAGTVLNEGVSVTLEAAASDDGAIARVEFYAGITEPLTLVGEDSTAPFTATFVPPSLGGLNTYTLRAVATDDGGLSAESSVTVKAVDPSLVIVRTSEGRGADLQLNEHTDNASGATASNVNTRTSSNGDRNEVVALRFDLSGYSLEEISEATLNIVNFRDNSARQVALYGVKPGTAGGTGVYTTDDWPEAGITVFGDLPGLLVSDGDFLTQSLNEAALAPLGQITFSKLSKGTEEIFSDPAITAFLQGYSGGNLVTFLLAAAPGYTSTGQARFATKEATELEGGSPTGAAGDFAPYLSFKAGGSSGGGDISITTHALDGAQLTLTWSGGTGPYTVQRKTRLQDAWVDEATGLSDTTATVEITGATGFFRVVGR